MDNQIQKELRGLLVNYGVEAVNLEWVKLLTTLESQIKAALKKDVVVVAPHVPVSVLAAPVPIETPPTPDASVVDKKTLHKNAIYKKRAELAEQGIDGRTLLTEANIKKWLSEGKTYWKIAEQTGMWDAEVSTIAKSFGVQSEVSKFIGLKKK